METIDTELLRVLRGLDPKEPSHFTKSGKPDCNHLSEKLGRAVGRDEADQAYASLKAAQDPEPAQDTSKADDQDLNQDNEPAQEESQSEDPGHAENPNIAPAQDAGQDAAQASGQSAPLLSQAPIASGEKPAEEAKEAAPGVAVKAVKTRRMTWITRG